MMCVRLLICLLLLVPALGEAAIVRVQTGITTYDGATNFTRATTSNVTAGSLLIVGAGRWYDDNTAYVAGDLTKSAGTATIGTPVLEYTASPGANTRIGIWSVLVTGSGTLTMQVAHPGVAYGSITVAEYSGSWDASRTETSASSSGSSTAPSSGNATSAGAAVFIGGMHNDHGSNSAIGQDGAFLVLGEDEDGSSRAQVSFIEQIVGSGTTDAAQWTITSSAWVAGVVVFKEAGGGGGGGVVPRMTLMGVGP